MKIHTDRLNPFDLYYAARLARVDLTFTEHGSRSRQRAFNITLRGESNRSPNYGTSRTADRFSGEKAATWDQWGVFLAVLFDRDDERTFEPSRGMFTPYDADSTAFHYRTSERFKVDGARTDDGSNSWPDDAHGDHRFKYQAPFVFGCTKCGAVQRHDKP